MPRLMYDSVTPTDLPRHRGALYAGYTDGTYANLPAIRHRFPKATVVGITPHGQPRAPVCDRETGDLTALQAASWAKSEHHSHRKPTIYCNLAALGPVLRALKKAGLTVHDYWILTAHWTGHPHICDDTCLAPFDLPFRPHLIGTQYADPATSGGHYDVSLVADYWPGVDKPRKPKKHRPVKGSPAFWAWVARKWRQWKEKNK